MCAVQCDIIFYSFTSRFPKTGWSIEYLFNGGGGVTGMIISQNFCISFHEDSICLSNQITGACLNRILSFRDQGMYIVTPQYWSLKLNI